LRLLLYWFTIYIMTETIDITPTWASLILPMIEVLKNPKASRESKTMITDEFIRLAKIVDDQNRKIKENG